MRHLIATLLLLAFFVTPARGDELSDAYTALRLGDFNSAFKLFQKAATGDSAKAQYELGRLYLAGRGTDRDITRGHYWLEMAAESGHAGAQFTLGLDLLESGDTEAAKKWLQRAAAAHHPKAQAQLDQLSASTAASGKIPQGEETGGRWQRAAVNCDWQTLKHLLEAGANIDSLDSYQRNALHYLVACDHQEGAAALVARNINIDNRDMFGETPLTLAIKQNSASLAKMLIEAGATPTPPPGSASLPHLLVTTGQTPILAIVLAASPSLEVADTAGNTALDIALANGNTQAQRLLESAGAKRTTRDPALDPASLWERLRQAALQDDAEQVAALLDKGGERDLLSRKDSSGYTLLLYAANSGSSAVVAELLSRGAAPDQRNSRGDSALLLAAGRADLTTLSTLLNAGADPLQRDSENRDAILRALDTAGSNQAALALLKAIEHRQIPGALSGRYLLIASRNNARDVIDWLITLTPAPDVRDERGRSAAWYAAGNCDDTTLHYLLSRKTPIDQPDKQQFTELHTAAEHGCRNAVNALLSAGAALESRTAQGNTALMLAVQNNHVAIANLLLQRGANVAAVNQTGDTPLIRAVMKESTELTELLLEAGADPYRRNKQGESASSLAQDTAPALAKIISQRRRFPW